METLEIAKVLEGAGIPHDPAYKIAEAINGRSGLATKEDIGELRAEVKADIAEVKQEIAELRKELKEDIADVKEDVAELRSDMKWMKVLLPVFGSIIVGLVVFFGTKG